MSQEQSVTHVYGLDPGRAGSPKSTYKDRAVALARRQSIVTPDDLGGVCVYRCQVSKLCDLELWKR